MPRTLRPGQQAELRILDVDSGDSSVVYVSKELLFEAPNWTGDGRWLIVNGGGRLWRIAPSGSELEEIPMPDVPPINNDHVISPDAATAYVSSEDGHLYAIPLEGGDVRRVSNEREDFTYYLHGVSPDGSTLAYIGMEHGAGRPVRTNVFTIPSAGGPDVQLTDDAFPDDGSEYGPDGSQIYFNSERASTVPGHAQLFRMGLDGEDIEQLTSDERVNWFPHVSPTGERIAFVSFPPGTTGHPADVNVIIRILENGTTRDVAFVPGGQGTMNVPSWDPSGSKIAYVAYPFSS